jgi:hypothetical protein
MAEEAWHPEEAYDGQLLVREEVVELLVREVHAAGGPTAWAAAHDVSPAYVRDVIKGHRTPGPKILVPLHVTADCVYRRTGDRP